MSIKWPANTVTVIDDIRDAIGRDITIYKTISGIACPDCSLDPVTNLSTNQFCSTCHGSYWMSTPSGCVVKAYVLTRGIDTPVMTVGGYIVDGDAQVQIKYTVANMDLVDNAEWYHVDSKKFIKKNIMLKGVPDINRIIITLVEKE